MPIAKRPRTFAVKRGWRTVGGREIFFRSGWEYLYANYLQWLKEQKVIADWEYEPHTFWFESIKRGARSYKPDFRILKPCGAHYWVEVKGYMDARSKTQQARMKRYYPQEIIQIVDRSWFARHSIRGVA